MMAHGLEGAMLMLVSAGVAALLGLLSPYGSRWQATSLWAGKAMAPPEAASSMPRGVQDALANGPESWLGIANPLLLIGAGALSFRFAWWGPIVVLFTYGAFWIIADRTITPRTVDWYLLRLHTTLANRAADYAKSGDVLRADAAVSVDNALLDLYRIYQTTGTPAPTMALARRAPLGDDYFLIHQAEAE
jgi:hypothetical protein